MGPGCRSPRTWLLCEDPDGRGHALLRDALRRTGGSCPTGLPGLSPADRGALCDDAVTMLARLHQVDWQAVGLADFGRPGNYYARQLHRWVGQYRASETESIEAVERLVEWLPAHAPGDDTTTLVHGDFRLGNMVVHPTAPRIVAVLTGSCRRSATRSPTSVTSARRTGCRRPSTASRSRPRGLGIPSEETSVRPTVAYGPRGIPDWHFYVAFACSGWPPSARASWVGSATARPVTPTRAGAANARGRWPSPRGRWWRPRRSPRPPGRAPCGPPEVMVAVRAGRARAGTGPAARRARGSTMSRRLTCRGPMLRLGG